MARAALTSNTFAPHDKLAAIKSEIENILAIARDRAGDDERLHEAMVSFGYAVLALREIGEWMDECVDDRPEAMRQADAVEEH